MDSRGLPWTAFRALSATFLPHLGCGVRLGTDQLWELEELVRDAACAVVNAALSTLGWGACWPLSDSLELRLTYAMLDVLEAFEFPDDEEGPTMLASSDEEAT